MTSTAAASTTTSRPPQSAVDRRYLPASGFQPIPEVVEPVTLAVTGILPNWLSGALYRLTASKFDIPLRSRARDTEDAFDAGVVKAMHWFDGLSMLHKYEMDGGTNSVRYRSRITSKDTEAQIVSDGCYAGFGPTDPCRSLFKRVMSAFLSDGRINGGDGAPNLNVTITPTSTAVPPSVPRHAGQHGFPRQDCPYLIAKTDYNILQLIDPITLSPLPISPASSKSRFTYTDLSPDFAGGVTSAAHHHQDPESGDYYHIMVDIQGPKTQLIVFCVPAQPTDSIPPAPPKPRVVARVPIGFAPYIHSFAATTSYLVFFLQPYYLGWMGLKGAFAASYLDALTWDPKLGTKVIVVHKHTGECVRIFDMPDAMFFFHMVNAWEVDNGAGGLELVVDVIAYDSPSLVYKMAVNHMAPELRKCAEPSAEDQLQDQDHGAIRRYVVPITETSGSRLRCDVVSPKGVELPRINPLYATRPSRFVYCMLQQLDEPTRQLLDPGRDANGFMRAICKVDTKDKVLAAVWTAPGCYPGEPVFVPRPSDQQHAKGALDEDDGVVVTVVLDALRAASYLLVLDGKTFWEVARAELDGPMPFGFHGSFVGRVKEMDAVN